MRSCPAAPPCRRMIFTWFFFNTKMQINLHTLLLFGRYKFILFLYLKLKQFQWSYLCITFTYHQLNPINRFLNTLFFYEMDSAASQYVKLNVGGALFQTTLATLTKYDCMFRAMFSGRNEVFFSIVFLYGYCELHRLGVQQTA